MLTVLAERWLSQGWRVMDAENAEPMAESFIRALDRHSIPFSQYMELYRRGCDLRSQRLAQGLKCDDFSSDLMIACWPALREELRQREINAGRTLTTTSETQCLRCFGSGMEKVYDDNGTYLGTRPGCKHEHLDTSQPTMDGFDAAFEALHRPAREESAVQICSRIRQELAYLVATAPDQDQMHEAWAASRTWAHAEAYCRENPEVDVIAS